MAKPDSIPRRRAVSLSLAALALAIASVSPARAAQILCPREIKVAQQATAPGAEWTVTYNGMAAELAGVTIYEGPPSENASMVYDSESKLHGGVVQTWKFQPSTHGYWLKCRYTNTSGEIARKLPAGIKQCTVAYERGVHFADGGTPVKSAVCK
jgi:hypothetical protein